jgi:hypothetical protein
LDEFLIKSVCMFYRISRDDFARMAKEQGLSEDDFGKRMISASTPTSPTSNVTTATMVSPTERRELCRLMGVTGAELDTAISAAAPQAGDHFRTFSLPMEETRFGVAKPAVATTLPKDDHGSPKDTVPVTDDDDTMAAQAHDHVSRLRSGDGVDHWAALKTIVNAQLAKRSTSPIKWGGRATMTFASEARSSVYR